MQNTNKTILLVEDDMALQRVAKDKLVISGFNVLTATNVPDAMTAMQNSSIESPINAIWLDHYLTGEQSGLDLMSFLRTSPSNQNLPVFLITNTASSDKIHEYTNLGIKKYFIKSDYGLQEIISEITTVISS
ncbi:MAG: response regulator [Candidatus Nomurabacteria bacterium]|nr:response regulator [Candidatus Nomurabacteria bacterium]